MPVKIKYGSSPVAETYAMLDSGREGTFIEKRLLKELKISGRNANITVKTLNRESSEESIVINGLEVANGTKLNSNGKWIGLSKTYSKEKLSIGGGNFKSKQLQSGDIWIKFKEKYVRVRM